MEKKMVLLRSICRAACSRSTRIACAITHNHLRRRRHHLSSSRSNFSLVLFQSPPFWRYFSEDVSQFPGTEDPQFKRAFKDLMTASWEELPDPLIYDVKTALCKNTDDKAGQDILKNVFLPDEAVEEFSDILMNLKMELDDKLD